MSSKFRLRRHTYYTGTTINDLSTAKACSHMITILIKPRLSGDDDFKFNELAQIAESFRRLIYMDRSGHGTYARTDPRFLPFTRQVYRVNCILI